MIRGITGSYKDSRTGAELVRAFVPHDLPPSPKIEWVPELAKSHEQAIAAVGRLDGVVPILPDATLFLYSYIRKEAILSSQIEGTQSSLTDLFAYEAGETANIEFDDVTEVSNYVAALEYGVKRVREGFPVSGRLVREVHKILLSSGRGEKKDPGEFRTSQNWIAGSRPGNALFVPPPPDQIGNCFASLENFLNNIPHWTSTLVKAALAHVQFETIHPFLDGNGRVGRLLVTLVLCAEGLLREPMLYLSLYFKENRGTYYELLQRVRTEGIWEEWLLFFFAGVTETANEAAGTAQALLVIFNDDQGKIRALGRRGAAPLQLHHEFQRFPILSASQLVESTRLSLPTVQKALEKLSQLGMVTEITGRKRNRLYSYGKFLDRLQRGATPLP